MTTAQLQFQFGPQEVTQPTPNDKSLNSGTHTNGSAQEFPVIRVKELLTSKQDYEILELSKMMAADVELKEHIEDDRVLYSCILCRMDVDRKNMNIFIAYYDEKPIGFLVGVASPAWHRQGIVAEQKLCYVSPDRRGSTAAIKLFKAYERWARTRGATQIFTGTANIRYAERTSKLLTKLGYARVGALHVKEI